MMTSWVSRSLDQRSVYWKPPKRDGFGGYIWTPPFEIASRWEDRYSNVFDVSGVEVVSRAVVWVDEELEVGGYLWLGALVSTSNDYSPPIDSVPREYKSIQAEEYEEEILGVYETYAAQIVNKKRIVSLNSEKVIYRKVFLK